jgi:aromatic-L-amino-acid/L-tryptophan decarboxylase
MLNWLGKMLDLPQEFLASSGGKGGGVIQGTASEATLVALLGAKAKTMQRVKAEHPDWDDYTIVSKLVAYCSGKKIFSEVIWGFCDNIFIKNFTIFIRVPNY